MDALFCDQGSAITQEIILSIALRSAMRAFVTGRVAWSMLAAMW
jgi:hypothetical protein